MVDPDRPQTTI